MADIEVPVDWENEHITAEEQTLFQPLHLGAGSHTADSPILERAGHMAHNRLRRDLLERIAELGCRDLDGAPARLVPRLLLERALDALGGPVGLNDELSEIHHDVLDTHRNPVDSVNTTTSITAEDEKAELAMYADYDGYPPTIAIPIDGDKS